MEEHGKSLALQYDLFVNSTLKFLDTTIERDYMRKLRLIDELTYKINESEDDKKTIKKTLESIQDECSKLTYKLKTSARLLDEVKIEKEKLEIEKETMKSQLEQLYSVFKKPDAAEITQTSILRQNRSSNAQPNEKKTLNNTDALLSDISYSHSEESSYEDVIKGSKPNPELMKKYSASNILKELNTKTCEIKNMNINGGQIIATTTLTMDLGCVNAKSVLKTRQTPTYQTSKASLKSSSSSASVESLSCESENELKSSTNFNTNIEKEHNFVQKIIVIPEICGQCYKKIKFNKYMVKCLDCKTIAHLECKDLIPKICALHQYQINALNCGIPPFIVHCISEIERRGLDTIGLYRISGSDKELKILREKFHKAIPNLHEIDIHVLCGCLKDFIRTQKNNLISQDDLSKLANALKKNDEDSKSFCQVLLGLPSNNLSILAFLILHLQKVASSPKCNMDYNCLAIVFGPTIVGFSSTSLPDLHIKSEIIFKVVTEMLKLPKSFWLNLIKADSISSDEFLHSTPARNQLRTPGSGSSRLFSSGLKRRILDSPKKYRLKKRVDFEDKNESSE